MDEWMLNFLNMMFTPGFNGRANGKTQAQQDAQDKSRIKRETTKEVTTDGRFVRTTTLSIIQEGEFEEIEDTETGETSVGELADQTTDRREEILCDKADEGRVQGGGKETVCGLRDREEESDDSGGSD